MLRYARSAPFANSLAAARVPGCSALCATPPIRGSAENRPATIFTVEDLEAVELENAKPGEPNDETPEAALIAKADADQLRAAIAALPAPFRETLVLRDIEGLDYREIAEATEVPIGTVMSRLARARRRLIATIQKDR